MQKHPTSITCRKREKSRSPSSKPSWSSRAGCFSRSTPTPASSGWANPILEGRALTCATAVKEIEPYLVGKDPRQVVHHWQAIYRHAFYRGGPILTSALSGIDQALWDIKGKALGVPVYELLGGPTRDRVRVYAHAGTPAAMKKPLWRQGFTAFKTGRPNDASRATSRRRRRSSSTPSSSSPRCGRPAGDAWTSASTSTAQLSPATAKLLIKALEPYQPMFVEEPCQCQNHDVMAEIARGTHLPIATGERVFTKWGFREVLEKRAATILQPDLCHAGGITEVRLIAGMAEAYYAPIAPHNPLGPISLAAGVQLAASIPNFLVQEQVTLGEGYLKKPFKLQKDGRTDTDRPGPGHRTRREPDRGQDRARLEKSRNVSCAGWIGRGLVTRGGGTRHALSL